MIPVRAAGSKSTMCSMSFRERNCSLLSAMELKQWRVPSTFNRSCLRTNSRTCPTDLGEYTLSVPYSRFPAQFFSLSGYAHMNREPRTPLVARAEHSFKNDLLLTCLVPFFPPSLQNPISKVADVPHSASK